MPTPFPFHAVITSALSQLNMGLAMAQKRANGYDETVRLFVCVKADNRMDTCAPVSCFVCRPNTKPVAYADPPPGLRLARDGSQMFWLIAPEDELREMPL